MYILGIIGPAGVGKSTASDIIKQQYQESKTIAFAEEVKRIAFEMGWDGKKDQKGRRLLQLIGTECGRECINEHIWTDKWEAKVRECTADIVIADDTRFEDEVQRIQDMCGHVLKITGQGYEDEASSGHRSEALWDQLPYDYHIENDGDLFKLEANIKRMLTVWEWRVYVQ